MTCANTAILNSYQREQNAIADGEASLERLQQDLSDELYDAYLSVNSAVIDEVDDFLADYPWADRMRAAMVKESAIPVMGRGGYAYKAVQDAFIEAVESIAKKQTTPDEFDRFRHDFGL